MTVHRDYKYGGPVITERFDIDVKQDVKKEKSAGLRSGLGLIVWNRQS